MARAKAAAKQAPGKAGRPPKYRPEHDRTAQLLCRGGAIDAELAAAFGVDEKTIRNWRDTYPSFKAACEDKAVFDDRIERALADRALGYEHDAVKILQHEGSPVIVPYIERYPPDTTACIFWLKNRRPKEWRDRQEIEHDATGSFASLVAAAYKGDR